MTNGLFERVKSEYKNCELILLKSGKYLIKDFLYEGISVEFMPNNWNEFVIRFFNFKFFDLNSFESYFRKKLNYQDVRFEVNSLSIYVYINRRQSNDFRYEVFKYTETEIKSTIAKILNLLSE